MLFYFNNILREYPICLGLHAGGPGFDSLRGRSFFRSVLGVRGALSLVRTFE
jgi:hypothetical protein